MRRSGQPHVRINAHAQGPVLEEVTKLDATGAALIRDAADAMRLSARGYHRVLRVGAHARRPRRRRKGRPHPPRRGAVLPRARRRGAPRRLIRRSTPIASRVSPAGRRDHPGARQGFARRPCSGPARRPPARGRGPRMRRPPAASASSATHSARNSSSVMPLSSISRLSFAIARNRAVSCKPLLRVSAIMSFNVAAASPSRLAFLVCIPPPPSVIRRGRGGFPASRTLPACPASSVAIRCTSQASMSSGAHGSRRRGQTDNHAALSVIRCQAKAAGKSAIASLKRPSGGGHSSFWRAADKYRRRHACGRHRMRLERLCLCAPALRIDIVL